MKIVYNRILPFGRYLGINLFGVLFLKGTPKDIYPELLNHERIHTAQMRELGYVPFYLLYVVEWLWWLTRPGDAYRNISFEREAYAHESDGGYLRRRRRWAQWRR